MCDEKWQGVDLNALQGATDDVEKLAGRVSRGEPIQRAEVRNVRKLAATAEYYAPEPEPISGPFPPLKKPGEDTCVVFTDCPRKVVVALYRAKVVAKDAMSALAVRYDGDTKELVAELDASESPAWRELGARVEQSTPPSRAAENDVDDEPAHDEAREKTPHRLKQWAYVLNVRCGENQTEVAEKLNQRAPRWAQEDGIEAPAELLTWNQQKVSRAKQQVKEYLENGGILTIDAKAVEHLNDKEHPRTINTDPSEMAERFSNENR